MLTKGMIKKKYNAMLLASLLGWIVGLVGDLADSILAGQFISEAAVSATGLVSPLFNINFFFSVMIGLGSANRYALKIGRFDKDEAYKTAGQAIIMSVAAGALFCAAMFLGENVVFSFYSAGPEVEALAREYYEAIAILTFVAPPYWTIYYLVAIDGDEKTILISDIISAFGNFGASIFLVGRLGIRGLAYGSVISLVLSGLVLVPHFFSKRNSIHFKRGFSFACLKEVFFFGSTTAMTSMYIAVVDIVFNKFILWRFGDTLLAAYAIVNLILNLAQVSACACDSAAGFVGTAYAEENSVAMKNLLSVMTKTSAIISGSLMVLFFVFAGYAPDVYGIIDPAAYEASVYATRVLSLSYIPSSLIFIYLSYFPKIEKPGLGNFTGLMYSLITPIAIAMPLGLISYHAMSWGFFATPIVTLIIVGLILVKKFGKQGFPFPIPKSRATHIFTHEYALTNEEIVLVKDTIAEELKTTGVDASIINKLAVMIEETALIAMHYNQKSNPDKTILGDVTAMVFDDQVKLITRDNGSIFDITKVDEKLSSLEAYVAASLMNDNKENSNVTSVSFNRNLFCWDR